MAMMKANSPCPNCGSEYIYNRWVAGRKLQRGCEDCDWKEAPRIPEIQEIKSTRTVKANQFYGYCYEAFDKYGHIMTSSRSYNTEEEARTALRKELDTWNKDPDYAPCAGVLWPSEVQVIGEVIT